MQENMELKLFGPSRSRPQEHIRVSQVIFTTDLVPPSTAFPFSDEPEDLQ